MINPNFIQYDLVVISPKLERLHVFQLAEDLQWEENEEEFAVRLSATFQDIQTPYGWIHELFPNGAWIILYADWGQGWTEVYRGRTFRHAVTVTGSAIIEVISYDPLRELLMSEDDRFYGSGTTAKFIFEDIFTSWGLPNTVEGPDTIVVRGDIETPEIGLAQQVFRGTRLGEMLISVLDQVRLKKGGKFIIQSDQGAVNVVSRGKNSIIYHFGQDIVSSITDDWSIEDLVTIVKVVGTEDADGKSQIEDTILGLVEFGTFQRVIYSSKFETLTAARDAGQHIIDEEGKEKKIRRIQAPDLPFLRRGHAVHVQAGTLDGYYYVTGVQHDTKTRTMTFSVEDLLP